MIIVCPGCQAKYKFDESKLGSRLKVTTKCTKCGGTIEIDNPAAAAMTLPPGAVMPAAPPPAPPEESTTKKSAVRNAGAGTITGHDLHKVGALELPKDKRYSLAVIQGAATGQIYQIITTRTTMGRSGSDVNLDDPEASRQHAVVEIFGERALLRDLGSTNGTYVDQDRIDHRELANQMEFRIGSHVLMFIVTDVE